MRIFRELQNRRRELGMSLTSLAHRSHVSLPTVNRIMSARHPQASFAHVAAIAEALGVELTAVAKESSDERRTSQARAKARRLVGLVQGTSGLEGQALEPPVLKAMTEQTTQKLLRSNRMLWAE
jgi:transcriptional regulator with XRE-family HTH domain